MQWIRNEESPRAGGPPRRRGLLAGWITRVARGPLRHAVTRALALTPRGFIPNDVLLLTGLSARVRVEWRRRGLHPWDGSQPPGRQCALLHEQTLRDTDEAILRLFEALPDMEAIEIRVLEPDAPDRLVLSGTVAREDAIAARSLLSVAMRLKMMGIRCHPDDARRPPVA